MRSRVQFPHRDAAFTLARAALLGAGAASGRRTGSRAALDDRVHEPFAQLAARRPPPRPPGRRGGRDALGLRPDGDRLGRGRGTRARRRSSSGTRSTACSRSRSRHGERTRERARASARRAAPVLRRHRRRRALRVRELRARLGRRGTRLGRASTRFMETLEGVEIDVGGEPSPPDGFEVVVSAAHAGRVGTARARSSSPSSSRSAARSSSAARTARRRPPR